MQNTFLLTVYTYSILHFHCVFYSDKKFNISGEKLEKLNIVKINKILVIFEIFLDWNLDDLLQLKFRFNYRISLSLSILKSKKSILNCLR